jgi:proline iminopeptidase
MNNLLRTFAIAAIIMLTASLARAQEGSSRAELECLALANSSSLALAGDASSPLSFHHIWTPGLSYGGTFQSNGLNFVYETQGTGDEVVIVVHGGAGLPHEYFHPMLSNLSSYAKIVYFDRRADTLSAKAGHGAASIEEMADDIEALRTALGVQQVTLLGHSFGATIVLEYALRHSANVKRLILVSAAAAVENPSEGEKRILKTLTPAEMKAYGSTEGGTNAANPCQRVRTRYSVLYPHYFHKLVPYAFDRGVYTVYFDALSKKVALASDDSGADLRGQLSRINAPTLIVAGRHDLETTPDQTSELASSLPHSKLVMMEHSGHFPFFEENYLFTEWVRQFLTATASQTDRIASRTAVAETPGGSH